MSARARVTNQPPTRRDVSRRETAKPARDRERAADTTAAAKAGAATAARADAPTKPDRIDGSVVLRGRRANRNIIWRVRDRIVEHSVDGGATWMEEHTSDRAIRAGAFVDANVAWLAGDQGLVLRRTKNGWFSASPPAAAAVTAVNASSPSKATVTLDDGRLFATENGGVSWSEAWRDK